LGWIWNLGTYQAFGGSGGMAFERSLETDHVSAGEMHIKYAVK